MYKLNTNIPLPLCLVRCYQRAATKERAPSRQPPAADTRTQRPPLPKAWGGWCKQRLGHLGTWDLGQEDELIHPPGAKNMVGSDGTHQTSQEHPPSLLQSQQSLLDIRHPPKTLETKPNTIWAVSQEW